MTVSLCIPVMRSIKRIEEPSANAANIEICLSLLSTFAVVELLSHTKYLTVKDYLWAQKYI
jgi:hypothetical protein